MQTIVTKEWLADKAQNPYVLGRALVAIFNNQTAQEQSNNLTRVQNGVGFTQADARIGSLGAKYFLKHDKLEDWHVRLWMKPNKHGQPKIVKYANQLNEIAKRKQHDKN